MAPWRPLASGATPPRPVLTPEAREKGAGVDLLVNGGALRQNHPYPHVGCVHLHNELTLRFGDLEDGGSGEASLEGVKGALHFVSPAEGCLG